MKRAPIALAELTEKEWQRQVVELAAQLAWKKTYHVYDSRRSHSGFPDLVLVRDRILFAELKRENTGPTSDQIEWLNRLAKAGGEVYLWKPSDLDEVSRVLASRGPFDGPSGSLKTGGGWWQPGSLWIAGTGRADTAEGRQESLLA